MTGLGIGLYSSSPNVFWELCLSNRSSYKNNPVYVYWIRWIHEKHHHTYCWNSATTKLYRKNLFNYHGNNLQDESISAPLWKSIFCLRQIRHKASPHMQMDLHFRYRPSYQYRKKGINTTRNSTKRLKRSWEIRIYTHISYLLNIYTYSIYIDWVKQNPS